MIWLVTAIVFIVTFLVWHYKTHYSVWSKQNVQGPLPFPLVGNALRLFIGPNFAADVRDFKKYGPIFGTYIGTTPALMVNDVNIIKTVSIKDAHIFPNRQNFETSDPLMGKFLSLLKGEEWKRGRKAVSPVFSTGKLKKMYPLMERCADEALDALKSYESGRDLNVQTFWPHYAMNVIAKCCFATDINCFQDENNDFLRHAHGFFRGRIRPVLVQFLLPNKIRELFDIKLTPKEPTEFFGKVMDHLLKQHRQIQVPQNNKAVDFVQLLLDTQNEANKSEDILVDDDFIKAQSLIFFVAGYETTANLLTSASYLLATNQNVQEKLYQSLTKLQQEDGRINYEDLMSCKYLDAFVSETLRLYPPGLRIERVAEQEYLIPGHDIVLPKGGSIIYNPYCVHRNPDYYSEPELFNPERFMPENSHLLVPNTQLAFGLGPRNCIAMRFSLLEAKLVLARTLLLYQFVKTKATRVPLEFVNAAGLLKAKSVIVGIKRR